MNPNVRRFGPLLTLALIPVAPNGCGGKNSKINQHVDPVAAQARGERPVQVEVEVISIPRDPALPMWVVIVEPFAMGASGVTSGVGWTGGTPMVTPQGMMASPPPGGMPVIDPGSQIGPGVAAQLLSTLQRTGNVAVIDYATYLADPRKITAGMKAGEQGPFLVKGTVTEFSETTDLGSQGESRGPSLGLMMIPVVGGIAAYGHGSKAVQETHSRGMVAMDVQIIDPSSGRLLDSFTAEGTFTSMGTMIMRTKWGKTKTSTEYVSSALGQATRIALNKAVTQIHAALARTARRTES